MRGVRAVGGAGAAGLLLALLALLPGVLSVDPASVDDADLVVRRALPPSSQNAATYLERAIDVLVDPQQVDRAYAAREPDAGVLSALIERNAPALAQVERALGPHAFEFARLDPRSADAPDIVSAVTLAHLLALRSASNHASDSPGAAFQDAVRILRLGHRIEAGHGATIAHAVVGLAVKRVGLDAVQAQLGRYELSGPNREALAEAIERHRTDGAAWRRAWSQEYRFVRDSLVSETGDGLAPWISGLLGGEGAFRRFGLWPGRTLSRLAPLYREFRAASDAPCQPFEGPTATSLLNPGGRRLLVSSQRDFAAVQQRRCALDTRLDRLVAALSDREES